TPAPAAAEPAAVRPVRSSAAPSVAERARTEPTAGGVTVVHHREAAPPTAARAAQGRQTPLLPAADRARRTQHHRTPPHDEPRSTPPDLDLDPEPAAADTIRQALDRRAERPRVPLHGGVSYVVAPQRPARVPSPHEL